MRLLKLMLNQQRYYRSPIQKLLDAWDVQNPQTPSQQAEINKHLSIFEQRDHP